MTAAAEQIPKSSVERTLLTNNNNNNNIIYIFVLRNKAGSQLLLLSTLIWGHIKPTSLSLIMHLSLLTIATLSP